VHKQSDYTDFTVHSHDISNVIKQTVDLYSTASPNNL